MNEIGAGAVGMALAIGLGTIAIAMVWTFLPVVSELKEIRGALRDIAEAIRGDDDDPHPPPPLTTRAKPFSRTPPSSSK